ncbi:phenylacetate--CoA ligase family protein [Simiduia agarivorans]|uniref:Coenzyme F390 synthetase n=1 Tax=Simiduia agarivorans (strain DSM 21679 / JCM 13881 / BCRC 17597 / SA1) TaxID=1117647 RepID=K4KLK3_SIMAS|nr:phenylacetate--CoA ligase family protein [Simiduia agarivorans]AFU98948.1 coenzyme F390 synthetase [Simiduia agarivorans SA1 = DSM 21679]
MLSLDSVYMALPARLQDFALSFYGYRLKSDRYGAGFTQCLNEVKDLSIGFEDSRFVTDYQGNRLFKLLEYAKKNVPYYQDCYENLTLRPNMSVADMLKSIPILDKDIVRRSPELFKARLAERDHVEIQTSGSSGAPLNISCSKNALKLNYAHFENFLLKCGVSSLDRSATFAGRKLFSNGERKRFCRINYAMNTLLCSSYHISSSTAAAYMADLERWAPEFIDSYPSAIYELSRLALSQGIRYRGRLKCIVTSSETLHEHQRVFLEGYFGCPVYDQYGQAEMAGFLAQYGTIEHYIANPFYGIAEVLGEDGRHVLPGESGALVLTGFVNEGMPLIRYRIGDRVTVLDDSSALAGSHALKIRSIEGRQDDVVTLSDGRRVGRLDPAFKGVVGIVECQIVQEAVDLLVLNVVLDSNSGEEPINRLKGNLRERLDDRIEFKVVKCDEIPRNAAGKFRSVVSKVL